MKTPRNYAAEHRARKQITPAQRRTREAKRGDRTRALVARGAIAWSTGNAKLKKLGIVSFGIPAGVAADGFNTCPAKGECGAWCYARQGFYVWPHVAAALERNLAIVRGNLDRFVTLAIRDLGTRKQPHAVRIHDSGDFFSLEYLQAWFTIARRLPQTTFYCYTKMFYRFETTFAFAPKNFRMIQSLGGLDDAFVRLDLPHARVFVTHAEREAAGYVDGTIDDGPAIRGEHKIGLVYHSGGKRLTAAQARSLRILPNEPAAPPEPGAGDARADVALTLKAAVELDGDVTDLSDAEVDEVLLEAGVDSDASLARLQEKITEKFGTTPAAEDPAPAYRSVTVALNARQWELLGNLVSVGACGDTHEAAAGWILAEGLLRHFPKAFASLGFKL